MIGTRIMKGQGLGNQLFCYVTARCLALDKQTGFSVPGGEILLRSLTGRGREPFMDLWLGEPAQDDDFERIYEEKEERIFTGTCRHDLLHGCYVAGADQKLTEIEDGTLLLGNMQAESYFAAHKKEIKQWLTVKPAFDSHAYTKDNLCIMNLRGGEYASEPALFLRKKYWLDAMACMKQVRTDMQFMIVTDDVEMANKLLPGIPAHHSTIDKDYVTVKNARYLILSNSSFACFPALTSDTVRKIIAPKYWARHNVSDGYWASEQNIYTEFTYLDRRGKLFTAEECRRELENYKAENAGFAKKHAAPGAGKKKLLSLQTEWYRIRYYAGRAVRSLIRRSAAMIKKV